MYTDNQEYTAMRLQNTVVRDRKERKLVHVLDVDWRGETLCATVCIVEKEGDEERKESYNVPLNELDLRSPPLGNIDFRGHTYYVSRVPKRNDWRQGIRKDNLAYTIDGRMYAYNIPTLRVLNVPVFNRYKPYKMGRAFSRNFSVDKEGSLWYKCREIVGRDIDGVPVLKEKFEWLKEALEDALER